MKIVLTGGAGFVGSHIAEALLANSNVSKVRIVDNLSTGDIRNISPLFSNSKLEFLRADIRFYKECENAVAGMDLICHQAAIGSVPRSIDNPLYSHDNNVNGFLNIIEAGKNAGIKKVVYASSSSVYGDSPDLPKIESKIGKPLSPYAATKYINELYAEVYAKCYGMSFTGFRYFNVFGPRQNPNGPYAAVIPLFVSAALSAKSPIINGDGTITRDYTFVKNVVKANVNALLKEQESSGSEIFNIACGKTITLNKLWEIILEITGESILATHVPQRKGDILQSLADISKAEEKLFYSDLIQLHEGLIETINWYKTENRL
ncbi:MAG: NAD-dependent epimerase/dehydratase family protein [Chitinophagaceae bacterium]|nr:NAD-dependent epimerase/dehydratase family protein [Chitinophagaceae bacterium]